MDTIRFGTFELDLGRRLLLGGADVVHVSPKALKLLEVLIRNRPNAMSKQNLHDEVWPGTFVSEATLAGLIKELREALGDDARSPRFIRTAFSFGYAFCGEATAASGADSKKGRLPQGFIEWDGHRAALAEGENVIGRDPSVAVFIDDATVSRHHARLTIDPDRATLEDLGSKNGTFVGDAPIGLVALDDGSEFSVGSVRVVFRRGLAGLSTVTFDRS
jgi:DNA-binding winged helix-turn-helix (wHTH) protein